MVRWMCFLALGLALSTALAQEQILITPDSTLLDEHGEPIEYGEFMKRMETGEFMPRPVRGEDGSITAYRLAVKPAAGEGEARRRLEAMRIRSTAIDAPVAVDVVSHHYLFAPIDVFNGEEWFHYYAIFDTGTLVPVILLPEIMKEFGKAEKVRVGGVEFTSPPMGAYSMPDAIRDMNRFRTEAPEKFEDRAIAGIIGGSLFENYLVSIDSRSGRLTLRPLDSEQRTLRAEAPIAATAYRPDMRNVWFPVTVNGIEGFVHYDTGNPNRSIIAGEALEETGGALRSFVVGGVDIVPLLGEGAPIVEEDMRRRYGEVMDEMNVLANLGNRSTDDLIVTIDPREKTIYFERRAE